jgi:hypothetical protein
MIKIFLSVAILLLIILLAYTIYIKYKQITSKYKNELEDVNIISFAASSSNEDCPISFGAIDENNKKAWCAADITSNEYLQSNFDKNYKITDILTQGRGDDNQYVKKYKIEYYDSKNNEWKKLNKEFMGNDNNINIKINKVNIETNKIRIYPTDFHEWISMKVAFRGYPEKED